jgi:hypothetical protein
MRLPSFPARLENIISSRRRARDQFFFVLPATGGQNLVQFWIGTGAKSLYVRCRQMFVVVQPASGPLRRTASLLVRDATPAWSPLVFAASVSLGSFAVSALYKRYQYRIQCASKQTSHFSPFNQCISHLTYRTSVLDAI